MSVRLCFLICFLYPETDVSVGIGIRYVRYCMRCSTSSRQAICFLCKRENCVPICRIMTTFYQQYRGRVPANYIVKVECRHILRIAQVHTDIVVFVWCASRIVRVEECFHVIVAQDIISIELVLGVCSVAALCIGIIAALC